jgi:hypothetical protein
MSGDISDGIYFTARLDWNWRLLLDASPALCSALFHSALLCPDLLYSALLCLPFTPPLHCTQSTTTVPRPLLCHWRLHPPSPPAVQLDIKLPHRPLTSCSSSWLQRLPTSLHSPASLTLCDHAVAVSSRLAQLSQAMTIIASFLPHGESAIPPSHSFQRAVYVLDNPLCTIPRPRRVWSPRD